jgi:hypothetical protein
MKKPKKESEFTVSYLAGVMVKQVTGKFLMYLALSESVTVMVLEVGKEHFWINIESLVSVKVSNPPPLKDYTAECEPQSNYIT